MTEIRREAPQPDIFDKSSVEKDLYNKPEFPILLRGTVIGLVQSSQKTLDITIAQPHT